MCLWCRPGTGETKLAAGPSTTRRWLMQGRQRPHLPINCFKTERKVVHDRAVDINSSSCEPVTSGAPSERRLLKRGAQESTHWASILPRGYYKLAETSEITVEATYEATISGDPQQSLPRVRAVHFILPQPQRGGHESETRAQVS